MSVITTIIECVLFIVISITERKWVNHPLSVICTFTIGIVLNFNGGNNGRGLKNITCEQTFTRLCHECLQEKCHCLRHPVRVRLKRYGSSRQSFLVH